MAFKVRTIKDSHNIVVVPHWIFRTINGDQVKIVGYGEPSQEAKSFVIDKLKKLLIDSEIELKNPQCITEGALVCEVFLNGVNIAIYFGEL